MTKLYFLFIVALSIISCQQKEGSTTTAPPPQTAPETDPLQEAKDEYGGLITFDKNKSEITVSSSPKLNMMGDIVSLPASHIAWSFYKNQGSFSGDSLRVILRLSDGSNPKFSFPAQQLKAANEKMPVIQQAADFLKKDDYSGLYGLFAPEVASQMTQQDLGLYCNDAFEKFGKPVGFTFQGFKFFTLSGKNMELIHLAGMLHREKQDTPLSLYVHPETGQVFSIKFDY